MKKIFATLIIMTGSLTVYSQTIADNAIGIRASESRAIGAEINYQRAILDHHRLEFGLGIRRHPHHDVTKLTGLFEWVWHIDGNFNWYAGPGMGIGNIGFDKHHFHDRKNEVFGYATGVVGIEYHFDFPLLLSFDVRPEVDFGSYRDDINFDVGISARYQF